MSISFMYLIYKIINIKSSSTDLGKTFGKPPCVKLKPTWPVMDFDYCANCKNEN